MGSLISQFPFSLSVKKKKKEAQSDLREWMPSWPLLVYLQIKSLLFSGNQSLDGLSVYRGTFARTIFSNLRQHRQSRPLERRLD